MSEQRLIDANAAMDEGTLYDWYIASVTADYDPVWTDEHIEDLCNDFLMIPKDTPTFDPVRHGKWIEKHFTWYCSLCNAHPYTGFIPEVPDYNYCPNCGAKMDKE